MLTLHLDSSLLPISVFFSSFLFPSLGRRYHPGLHFLFGKKGNVNENKVAGQRKGARWSCGSYEMGQAQCGHICQGIVASKRLLQPLSTRNYEGTTYFVCCNPVWYCG